MRPLDTSEFALQVIIPVGVITIWGLSASWAENPFSEWRFLCYWIVGAAAAISIWLMAHDYELVTTMRRWIRRRSSVSFVSTSTFWETLET